MVVSDAYSNEFSEIVSVFLSDVQRQPSHKINVVD